jgi:hypothetical protein
MTTFKALHKSYLSGNQVLGPFPFSLWTERGKGGGGADFIDKLICGDLANYYDSHSWMVCAK